LLRWLEHRGELLLAPIAESGGEEDPIYAYLASIERRKSEQETARLLYVATTRARRSLHLLGSVTVKPDGTIAQRAQPDSRSFLKLLWPALAGQFASPIPGAGEEAVQPVKTVRRLPPTWRVPDPPPAVKWKRPRIERVRRVETAFEWASDRARYAGAALHGFLQRIAREGLDAWDEAAVRSRRSAYRAVLMNLSVPPSELPWAVERVESALLRTLRDPRGRWVLDRHTDAASELPMAGLIEGDLYEVVIDRTFVDENGIRWVIDYKSSDYKTSAQESAGLENFLEQEKERYREQLERYARLMKQREQRPIRLGLYFPLLGAWLEWAAPGVLRKQASLFEL
jgi:ATP-dependent helicase/nuclease subunit A